MKKYTDKELLDELKRLAALLGRSPRTSDFPKHSKYSVNSYKRAFGGTSNAIYLIGERPFIVRNQSRTDMIDELKNFYKKTGKPPIRQIYFDTCSVSSPTFRKLTNYESWHAILKEIGVPDDELNGSAKKNITNDELKEEILRLKTILGRYPTYYDMIADGKFSAGTYEQRFDGWINAMHALGFEDYKSQSIYRHQIYVKGKDGITYKSNFESKIANILYNMKNQNKIKNYEYERKVSINKTWTCDFVILKNDNTEIWLEADGMETNRKKPYDENNSKIQFYKQNNINYYILPYAKKLNLDFLK